MRFTEYCINIFCWLGNRYLVIMKNLIYLTLTFLTETTGLLVAWNRSLLGWQHDFYNAGPVTTHVFRKGTWSAALKVDFLFKIASITLPQVRPWFAKWCSSAQIARKCNRRDHTSSSFQLWEVVFKCPYRKEVYVKHPKGKGNISIEKGIRSKGKCRSSAHFQPIWELTKVSVGFPN